VKEAGTNGVDVDVVHVKKKPCVSSGTASLVIVIVPVLVFVNVQVTVSPALSPMLATLLPSLQLEPVSSQPTGTLSETE
jgi:hypothetical protein